MDAVTGWAIAKTAGEISKKLYEFSKTLKSREEKQHVDEIIDKLRELKQSASDLEDENRELREKLRFRSDHYQFKSPFWYEKNKPELPLCPKCFADQKTVPVGAIGQDCNEKYRKCFVCNSFYEVPRHGHYNDDY